MGTRPGPDASPRKDTEVSAIARPKMAEKHRHPKSSKHNHLRWPLSSPHGLARLLLSEGCPSAAGNLLTLQTTHTGLSRFALRRLKMFKLTTITTGLLAAVLMLGALPETNAQGINFGFQKNRRGKSFGLNIGFPVGRRAHRHHVRPRAPSYLPPCASPHEWLPPMGSLAGSVSSTTAFGSRVDSVRFGCPLSTAPSTPPAGIPYRSWSVPGTTGAFRILGTMKSANAGFRAKATGATPAATNPWPANI